MNLRAFNDGFAFGYDCEINYGGVAEYVEGDASRRWVAEDADICGGIDEAYMATVPVEILEAATDWMKGANLRSEKSKAEYKRYFVQGVREWIQCVGPFYARQIEEVQELVTGRQLRRNVMLGGASHN